jgi:serine/threonine protein phosphatase PrpC
VRTGSLLGRDHEALGALAAIAEGPAAVTLSRGGAAKTYDYTEPNEDAVFFALGPGGALLAVADGHHGAGGSQAVIEELEARIAPRWTDADPAPGGAGGWNELAFEALLACNHRILADAAERRVHPAPTTLSLALVRPRESLLVFASMGDSHLFTVAGEGVTDLGWASLGHSRTYFLGYESGSREGQRERSLTGTLPLAGVEALVLATDGLSEQGIGVSDPAAAVATAVQDAQRSKPDLRPLEISKRVSQAAMAAHREQSAGDNIGCAVLWLGETSSG